jgi:hypothetical protein
VTINESINVLGTLVSHFAHGLMVDADGITSVDSIHTTGLAADIVSAHDVIAGRNVTAVVDITAQSKLHANVDVEAGQDVLAVRHIIAGHNIVAGNTSSPGAITARDNIVSTYGNIESTSGYVKAGTNLFANNNIEAGESLKYTKFLFVNNSVQLISILQTIPPINTAEYMTITAESDYIVISSGLLGLNKIIHGIATSGWTPKAGQIIKLSANDQQQVDPWGNLGSINLDNLNTAESRAVCHSIVFPNSKSSWTLGWAAVGPSVNSSRQLLLLYDGFFWRVIG